MAVAEVPLTRKVVERASAGERTRELLFQGILLLSVLVALVFLTVLLVEIARDGVGRSAASSSPRTRPRSGRRARASARPCSGRCT
jgi:hypothetical protein